MKITRAETDDQIQSCFTVLKQLRPHLEASKFVAQVRLQQKEGVVMAFLSDPEVRAVANYRLMRMFATGYILYVDDLITDSSPRSKGYGKAILHWLKEEARRLGCNYLELDSGLVRKDAHRFYRDNGMDEVGLHFSIPVDGGKKWSVT